MGACDQKVRMVELNFFLQDEIEWKRGFCL